MPAPIALTPLAWTALRLGAVAAMTLYASRRASQPKDADQEAMLDSLPEGIHATTHRAEAERVVQTDCHLRRVIRLRRDGPAFEIDAAGFGRFRLRRIA